MIIINFFEIYIYLLLSILSCAGWGYQINKFFDFNLNTIFEKIFVGIVFYGFFALFFNFFISINFLVNITIFLIGLILTIKLFKKKHYKIILLSALFGTLTIIFDNVYRPDAGLYHLPYTKILNSEKIIFGISNIHERFGFVSIIQYMSAAFDHKIFNSNGIHFPSLIIYISVLFFFINNFFEKNNKNFIKILSLIFSIVILVDMNRYSEFGNDEPGHLILFYMTFLIISSLTQEYNKNELFKKMLFLSVILFTIKSYNLVILLLLIIFYINHIKKIFLFNRGNILSVLLILFWIGKNIIVSGCLIFPIKETCIASLKWKNIDAENTNLVIEAFAKGYDYSNNESNSKDYIQNFKWIDKWSKRHLPFVLKKISPVVLILSILVIFIMTRQLVKIRFNKTLIFYGIISLFQLITILLKVPSYRFFSGHLYVTIIYFISPYLLNNNLDTKQFKILSYLLILCLTLVTFKNFNRINKNINIDYIEYPWPRKNSSFVENSTNLNKEVKYMNNQNYHYYLTQKDPLCYYNKAPCTSWEKKLDINFDYGYKIITNHK